VNAAEFWSTPRPGATLTAEQELVELWTRLRDCRHDRGSAGAKRRHRHHGIADDAPLLRFLDEQRALDAARKARLAQDAQATEQRVAEAHAEAARRLAEALRALAPRPAAQEQLQALEKSPEMAGLASGTAIPAMETSVEHVAAVEKAAAKRGNDNRRRAALLAALLLLDQ